MGVKTITSNYRVVEIRPDGLWITVNGRHLILGKKIAGAFSEDLPYGIEPNYLEHLFYKSSGLLLDTLHNMDCSMFMRDPVLYSNSELLDSLIVLMEN